MSADVVSTSVITLFVEHEEARHLIAVLTNDTATTEQRDNALTKLRAVFDKYLECPSLLDGHLEEMVSMLTESAQVYLNMEENDSLSYILSALYSLSKVRGRKRIQRFFPHETHHVEPVFSTLQKLSKTLSPSLFTTGPQSWESTYVLWIWMEMLALVPFDCSVVSNDTLIPSLVELAKSHLSLAGPIRETASSCLASWLNRLEGREELDSFLQWSHSVLLEFQQSSAINVVLVMGVMETLSKLLKCATNNEIHIQMEPLWTTAISVAESNSTMTLNKLFVKWFARMACAYLPPRIASWRYSRGRRSLLDNVETERTHSPAAEEPTQQKCDEDLFPVPDPVEDAMGIVLQSLTDASTMVRWSAAKGVGRMTERLPAVCADDVLDYILELCRDPEKDSAWHGACLALAELARRGLLLPTRLPDVVPMVVKAVQFDVRRGQSSVGAHVRDAACYTYWAFARAYAPSVLQPYVPELSRSIVLAFLFDREVNCRRAASAAFQECVGRQGGNNFKHGISILTSADYFSLGNVSNAYTYVALHVAQFPEYQFHIIDHLYKIKLFHWDIAIRTLASKSLHGLVHLDPVRIRTIVVPYLVEHCMNDKLNVRHGALLGLAEVMLALGNMNTGETVKFKEFDNETLDSVVELISAIEKARLYRGRGGEIMRSAVCRLIECLSQARVSLTVKQQVRYLDSIDACLKHPNEVIQEAASSALYVLMRSYFPVNKQSGPSDRLQKRVVTKYVSIVNTSVNPAETRGFSLALGSLPSKLLAPSSSVLTSVLDCLIRAARHDSRVGKEADAETRRNAIWSLSRVCETVGVGTLASIDTDVFSTVPLTSVMISKVYESFLLALEDYNVDRRGDVGSWSRVAAMSGLETLTYAVVSHSTPEDDEILCFDKSICIKVVGGLLKQFSEKLDSVRSNAGGCLSRMLTCTSPLIPFVPNKNLLLKSLQIDPERIGSGKNRNWANPSITYRMAMDAADIEELFPFIVSGMIISVGGLGESVSRESEEALLAWIRMKPSVAKGTDRSTRLADELLHLFQFNQRKQRVILPLLKTIEKLLNRGYLNTLIHVSDSKFCESLLGCMITEARDCSDVHTLLAIVSVSLGLLSPRHEQTLNDEILTFITRMLSHQFPRVRRFTADQMYVRLLEESDILSNQNQLDTVLQLLLEAPWDSNMNSNEINELSLRLAEMIGISLVHDSKVMDVLAPRKDRVVDEFASYASLVNSRS